MTETISCLMTISFLFPNPTSHLVPEAYPIYSDTGPDLSVSESQAAWYLFLGGNVETHSGDQRDSLIVYKPPSVGILRGSSPLKSSLHVKGISRDLSWIGLSDI